MPFVQRVVQPVNLAQVAAHGAASASAAGHTHAPKLQCIPGRCSNNNNNCLNQLQLNRESERERNESARELPVNGGDVTVKDTPTKQQQQRQDAATTVTKAIVHTPQLNGDGADANDHAPHPTSILKHVNGFAAAATTTSFSFATDTEEEVVVLSLPSPASPVPPTLSMKKLKQHVEFLSSAPSPARSLTRAGDASSHSQRTAEQQRRATSPQSPRSATAAKIIPGYEFDSISNITLSNALRQLASLVLIASDIFDDLQHELQSISERTRAVHRKMVAVERRVCAYDPKMVTVPESDLLTFAQRKIHYESDKALRKELFTADTRPRSVRVLYEDAGKEYAPACSAATTPRSPPFASGGLANGDGVLDFSDTGAATAAGSDELVCTPVFGKANRKMRTRIDAEIEIRLPAAIDDLRKWTSTEALGDVTVTPDCMHHVDTSICTSMIIGDNGILTPALSPSVLSADAVDALYSINVSNAVDNTQSIPNDVNKDVPLNHRLPSPEEQCKIIALRYAAEVISVDTSGKRFERMCMARKSTTGCFTNIADANNLNDDVQTVSRRSRSRKVRGKRRNTIAGTDQKEIQEAANGDSTATSGEIKNALGSAAAGANGADANEQDARGTDKSKKFGRSKSSDILKKESVALPYDKGKSTLTRLNSLKQWGRNRFKFMQSKESSPSGSSGVGGGIGALTSLDTSSGCPNTFTEQAQTSNAAGSSSSGTSSKLSSKVRAAGADIDDECVVHELITQKSEGRFSHERKPSYSSSEKSMSVSSSGHLKGKLHLATCGNVKLRDTSSLNRQRRSGITGNGLSGKEEQPHSSSGNWSASSESGRASIGSEITIQPKSSASNTSLNVSSFHPGSGPPSSMLSRRRFLNTSASSSVTSEGTATPDLQVTDGTYPNHLDDETSSAYSCDTEGYYTSFHMDSGLRTLKEEEPPMLALQNGQNLHTSNYSFGSQSNQTVLSAENEYELFGRGSTSTTTSSAGTVCTTLMVNGEQSSLSSLGGPDVPERISSLGKLNRSSHSNSASTSTLERSYSSSTIGSTLERTGTIKRNVNAGLKLATAEVQDLPHDEKDSSETPESQEDDFNFEQPLRRRGALPLPPNAAATLACEVDCSESSDLEGVERIERIKQKTALNAKRIPSMCIITPTTSDDENQAKDSDSSSAYDPNRPLTNESSASAKAAMRYEAAAYSSAEACQSAEGTAEKPRTPAKAETCKDHNLNVLKRNSNYGGFNNMFEKLKVVLPNMKRSPGKSSQPANAALDANDDDLYDMAGEYVTIADISNNNRHNQLPAPKTLGASSLGIYYSNDIVRRKLDVAGETAKANEPGTSARRETEYVSLNELPAHLRKLGSGAGASSAFGMHIEAPATPKRNQTNAQRRAHERECADAVQQQRESATVVPMYAEISELREEKPLAAPLCALQSPQPESEQQQPQHKGARVRINAEGKIIYDSDSLKRRKGAHTTFAPGPYVKESESALAETATSASGESVLSATQPISNSVPKSNAAKLLLLNGGIAANRKVANVRPIIATAPRRALPTIPSSMPITTGVYLEQQQAATTNTAYNYQENKNLLANQTNPFYQSNMAAAATAAIAMLPSPSTKSTSSTGSTISSSTSTHTSGSCSSSASSKEEGYQRFYKASDQPPESQRANPPTATPFQRNTPIYWTLQNRRQTKPPTSSVITCRDDLYATPIRRSERVARAGANSVAVNDGATISPIVVPRHPAGFLTSTPTKGDEAAGRHGGVQWDDNSPERFNTCSDRIGHSKTTLMDFKKLLLAKSAKTSPVQKKLSAVELLKKNSAAAASANAAGGTAAAPTQALNSSMKLLDLSGSPKTFANRRMLRQGQFGSPSKTFVPKLKSTGSVGAVWRHNDIMSTTIPEANSEEDHSSTSGSSKASSEAGDCVVVEREHAAVDLDPSQQKFDLKRNFFLQTEENNFMRGELKPAFGKSAPNNTGSGGSKLVSGPIGTVTPTAALKTTPLTDSSNRTAAATSEGTTSAMPALETAL